MTEVEEEKEHLTKSICIYVCKTVHYVGSPVQGFNYWLNLLAKRFSQQLMYMHAYMAAKKFTR